MNDHIRSEVKAALKSQGLMVYGEDIVVMLVKASFDIVRITAPRVSLFAPLIRGVLNSIEPKVIRLLGQ